MRKHLFLHWIIILAAVNLAEAQTPDAFVASINGKAWVRGAADAKPLPLKSGEGLFAGQSILCSKGCTISYCNVKVPVSPKSSWKKIYSIHCGPLRGPRGGGAKGENASIISPKESEHFQPESFSLRWKPFPAETKVQLSVKIYLGETVWGPETVDGSQGSYQSQSLKMILKRQQEAEHLVLVVTLHDKKTVQAVKFYLISLADQKAVDKRLNSIKNESDRILKAAGRGSAFGEFELYAQAAKEFERAVAVAERQNADKETVVELVTLAIQANYMGYNDERVKELCKSARLRKQFLPEPCSLNQ